MIEYIIKKRKITLLFFSLFVVLGILSFTQTPKQESPDIVVTIATVTTPYPGAHPEKVEQTVTRIIEERINEISGIKYIQSHSKPGLSSIIVELNPDEDPKPKFDEMRNKVRDAERDLPAEAHQPIINDDLNRIYAQTLNITAPSREELYSLRDTLRSWRDQLRTLPNVSNVTLTGLPEQEVHITLDMQKIHNYGIPWGAVSNAVQNFNEKVPLGEVKTEQRVYELVLTDVQEVDEFNNVLVWRTQNGTPIYLRDIATVELTTEDSYTRAYHNGLPAISLSISGETGSDIPSLQKQIDDMMAYLEGDLPVWAGLSSLYSQKERVDELFSNLTGSLFFAVIAVMLVCMLGMNVPSVIVVAMAIPIAIGMAFIPLGFLGITLNQISFIAIIIVLGILIDDAVVVNDNIERRLQVFKDNPLDSSIKGVKEVAISIFTANLATICAFAPLLFLTGNIGNFIKPVPIIIILAMLSSMIMSLSVVPIFRQWYESRQIERQQRQQIQQIQKRKAPGILGDKIEKLSKWYANKLMPILVRHPKRTATVGLLIGAMAYGLAIFTPIELFPTDDRSEMIVNVRTPAGTSLEETERIANEASKWILEQPGVKVAATYAGSIAPKMFSGDTGEGSGDNVAQIIVRVDKKLLSTRESVREWEEYFKHHYPQASIVPEELMAGPPVGAPVSIRVFGEDIETLRSISQEIQEIVKSVQGTFDIKDTFGVERYALNFDVDRAQMNQLMVQEIDLSRTIRLVSEGLKVTEFDTGQELIDVVLFSNRQGQDPLAAIQHLTVTNTRGEQIPLYQVSKIEPDFTLASIYRYNLSRAVTITGDVRERTATEVMNEIIPQLDQMNFPPGYRYEIAGETSEQTDVFVEIFQLFIVVVFLIIILMALQFYSLSLPILILSTIFLAFAGSLLGLFITQTPIGFMTMMGAMSLSGIVVRNGIILVEFIEQARRSGQSLDDAVISACEARLRPILLTSFTAIAGLMPLVLSGDVLFKPMAVAIISGLFFSTMLTLMLLPSLYILLDRVRRGREKEKA
ncbi:efflux RND transporter permease subunit [Heliorestis acidaminivorans]|uniref:Efflux RND transporter permease subunit n=1 Tax=Heliorestis acidaminivorans TaxID=553427 RepID=A0A6I0EV02_9FIRM|nr:efflux RND transporter permease subunit [Heliorestis acidaminivorans]KAB2953284.1 efflux RND transporter permease subunit [Heliorestis acidaminivorans]